MDDLQVDPPLIILRPNVGLFHHLSWPSKNMLKRSFKKILCFPDPQSQIIKSSSVAFLFPSTFSASGFSLSPSGMFCHLPQHKVSYLKVHYSKTRGEVHSGNKYIINGREDIVHQKRLTVHCFGNDFCLLWAMENQLTKFDKIVYDKFMYGTLHMQITQVSDLIHSMFLDRVRIIQHQHHISHTRNQWIPKWIGIMFRLAIILILGRLFVGGQSYHLINATPRLTQGRATGPGASLQPEWLCFWSFSSNCSLINSDLVI